MDFLQLAQLVLAAFTALVGWPALLSAITQLVEWVKPSLSQYEGIFHFWANALVFAGIGYLAYTNQLPLVSTLDVDFSQLAKLVLDVLVALGGGTVAFMQTRKVHTAQVWHGAFRKGAG